MKLNIYIQSFWDITSGTDMGEEYYIVEYSKVSFEQVMVTFN